MGHLVYRLDILTISSNQMPPTLSVAMKFAPAKAFAAVGWMHAMHARVVVA